MELDLDILEAVFTNKGNDLASIATENCVLLVFLRHFGCIYCREALDDFSAIKQDLIKRNVKLVFVHLAEEECGNEYLTLHGLKDEEHISDPDMSLYEYFGLQKGGFRELYGLKVWTRMLGTKHSINLSNPKLGNLKQMPGIFILQRGAIIGNFIHQSPADRPDYLSMLDKACFNSSTSKK